MLMLQRATNISNGLYFILIIIYTYIKHFEHFIYIIYKHLHSNYYRVLRLPLIKFAFPIFFLNFVCWTGCLQWTTLATRNSLGRQTIFGRSVRRFWSDAMAIATISATALHANIILIRSLVLLIRSNVSSDQTATTHQDNDSLETTIVASRCQLNNNNGTSLSNWAYCVPPGVMRCPIMPIDPMGCLCAPLRETYQRYSIRN